MGIATDEGKLIGWLCIWKLQHGSSNQGVMMVPGAVYSAWQRKGWVEIGPVNEDDSRSCNLTDLGDQIADLNAAEWGINPLEVV